MPLQHLSTAPIATSTNVSFPSLMGSPRYGFDEMLGLSMEDTGVCLPIKSINIRPFIIGDHATPEIISKVTQAIQAISTDPYEAELLSFIFNESQGFRIYLTTTKTNPYQLEEHRGSGLVPASFAMQKNMIFIMVDKIASRELIPVLRHELQHAYQARLAQRMIPKIGHIYPEFNKRAFSLTPEECLKTQKTLKNELDSLKSNPHKLTKKFKGLIDVSQHKFSEQGYFTFSLTHHNTAGLFQVAVKRLKVGLTAHSMPHAGTVRIIELTAETAVIQFPYTQESAIALINVITEQIVPSVFPPTERYRYLAEIDAFLHELFPHSIIKLLLPNFVKGLTSTSSKKLDSSSRFYSNYPDIIFGGITAESVFAYPDIFPLDTQLHFYEDVSLNLADYSGTVHQQAIKSLEAKMAMPRLTETQRQHAHLYLARLYYYKAAPSIKNFYLITGPSAFAKQACQHYKQVFSDLQRINLPFMMDDCIKYIFSLKEIAKLERKKTYLSVALNLAGKMSAALAARQKLNIPSEAAYLGTWLPASRQEETLLKRLMA